MALKWVITSEELDQLICSSCANYLSVFPIYLKSDNSGAICGRCTPTNTDSFIRDEAYELIADFLLFPCRYKKNDCEEELAPRNLEGHEHTCPCRQFGCPTEVYTKCEWSGLRPDLLKHFREVHPDLVLNGSQFVLNFSTSRRDNLLLAFEDELFIIKREVDARKENISCSVERFAAGASEDHYNYVLKFISNNNYSYKLPKKSTESSEAITVNHDSILEKLRNPSYVLVQIDIFKGDKEGGDESSKQSTDGEKKLDLNWEMLKELECPVCYDYMLPPIYQCNDGHSICTKCKSAVFNCPLCRSNILQTRNFNLEKLTQLLSYPCKFHESGCNHASKSVEIKTHEEQCEFGLFPCVLSASGKCQEKVIKSKLVAHVEDRHSAFILKSNRVKVNFNVNNRSRYFYFIRYSGMMFAVVYKYENRRFYWTVQMPGSVEESRKFKFDIDVVDNSKSNLKWYLKGFCLSLRETIDYADTSKYVMLTYEQLQPLITTTFDYYIHVMKEEDGTN